MPPVGALVFTSDYLEHVPDKPTLDALLGQAFLELKPGGRFFVLGPNLRCLPGTYWDFYHHHLGLTHLSLTEALRLAGFHVIRCIDRFPP